MIAMGEELYVSISFDRLTTHRIEEIIQAIVEIQKTRVGMTVHYDDPIGLE